MCVCVCVCGGGGGGRVLIAGWKIFFFDGGGVGGGLGLSD